MSDPTEGAAPAAEDPLLGRSIADRYRLAARLGRGAMGALYRAHDTLLERPVAVKVLDAKLVADPSVAQRFDREALAASRLDHPNCVRVFDAGTMPDGGKFIVMQLLEGRELRAIIAEGALAPARAIDFAVQILRALDHAHRRGLVHRDLKPENIFVVVDDDGHDVLKLVDFGIVKLLGGDDQRLTRAGLVFGTPRYMSPEQVTAGTIDERSDLYAVGVVLFEMLTGKPPFDADSAGILMRMHVLAEVPPVPESIAPGVRQLVAALLEKRPSDRPASAREVIERLTEASAVPPPPVPDPPRPTAPRARSASPTSSGEPPLRLPDPHVPARERPSAIAALVAALFVVAALVALVLALSSAREP